MIIIKDLQEEVKQYKKEIEELSIIRIDTCPSNLSQESLKTPKSSSDNNRKTKFYLNTVNRVISQKWEVYLTIVIKNKLAIDIVALIDSGVALNCLQEGLIPTQLYEKTKQNLFGANGQNLNIKYKLSDAHIYNQGISALSRLSFQSKTLRKKLLLEFPF